MEYDIAIIGSGPAGHTAAFMAAKHRLSAALIEKDLHRLGGVCLNEGCIPLKGLLYRSLHNKGYPSMAADVMNGVDRIRSGLLTRLRNLKVEIIEGEAAFISPGEVSVGGATISARHFLIAAGSSPRAIFNHPAVSSPDKIFTLQEAPQRSLIIGGGVIGCEYATLLNNIGSEVTVVEIMETLLPGQDEESVRTLQREFKKKKIRALTGSSVTSIDDSGVRVKTVNEEIAENFDLIIEATGRVPGTGSLALDRAGVSITQKGFIEVNDRLQTSVPNIYAVGDCIDTPMLAYTASREAEHAVTHMVTGSAEPIDYEAMPRLVFSSPQVGSAGLSRSQAEERSIKCREYRYFFRAIGKAVVEGKEAGFIRLLADADRDIIIGAALVGEEIVEVANELSVIIKNRVPIPSLIETFHIHPSYSEIIIEALQYGGV